MIDDDGAWVVLLFAPSEEKRTRCFLFLVLVKRDAPRIFYLFFSFTWCIYNCFPWCGNTILVLSPLHYIIIVNNAKFTLYLSDALITSE